MECIVCNGLPLPWCLNTVHSRLWWLEVLCRMPLPYWLLWKFISLGLPRPSLEIISYSNTFLFSRLFLSSEYSSKYFIVLCITGNMFMVHPFVLCAALGRQKTHTDWTSLIWKYEIQNALESETLWVPTWCHSGKFHTIKCSFMKKKIGLHKVTFRVQGICETLINFEFRFGCHPKTSSCIYC